MLQNRFYENALLVKIIPIFELNNCFQYHLSNLVYFGSHFDCEPLGLPLENVRLELV